MLLADCYGFANDNGVKRGHTAFDEIIEKMIKKIRHFFENQGPRL